MTRQEIERDYDVRDGVIRSPGKFEGEPLWVPYFYESVLNSCAEDFYYGEGNAPKALIEVKLADREIFPELGADTAFILLSDSGQGFVYATRMTQEQVDEARAVYEQWCEENSDEEAPL